MSQDGWDRKVHLAAWKEQLLGLFGASKYHERRASSPMHVFS